MSSSLALSTTTMSGVTRPALSQLVATHTSQSRSIWRCARGNSATGDKTERVSRRIDKYHRHPLANSQIKNQTRDWPSTTRRQSTGGWASWRSRSRFSDFSAGREESLWNTEREQLHQRMQNLKNHVAENPYGAIFGTSDSIWSDFLRSLPRSNQAAHHTTTDGSAKAHLRDFNFARSPQSTSFPELRYDPITGRMAPAPPVPQDTEKADAVVDCPPGSEVEATFASNPAVVEDSQQPGDLNATKPFIPKPLPKSQPLDCSPGSELESLFTSDPASFQNAQAAPRVPRESAHKPNIHIGCPPGNELEAPFISESVPSGKPHAETYNVHATPKVHDADAGLGIGRNVECPPGSELEAMFASKADMRADQPQPIETFKSHPTAEPAGISVDCPPGSELEAKFASELPPSAPKTASNTETSAPTIDCSPGSELETQIFSEIASNKTQQSEPAATVDCPPGSELEAMFIADPAAADAQHEPAKTTERTNSKKANLTVDCQPGHELEAKLLSDAASSGNIENMGDLQASDIRARYASMAADIGIDAQASKPRPTQNLEFSGSEDRVADSLVQNQVTSNKTNESAAYRVLAYESSDSQVTTTEAQTFFGTNDPAQPHEVLARLHHPAKFVPYFEQMQKDGYEIATGGGDILVLKKAANAPKQALPPQPAVEQDPLVHSQIAQYLRHDSYPTASSSSVFGSPSFTQVSRQ